jgi:alpha-amylase
MNILHRLALAFALLSAAPMAWAGVILQTFYNNVPSGGSQPYFWDYVAYHSREWGAAGFTAVWLPSPLKGNSGGYSMGYDPFDDYDLGSKFQKGTLPTRFGTREQLQKACAALRANGIDIYADMVLNHRIGDQNYNFTYRNAYGAPSGGRFGKDSCDVHFSPCGIAQDPNVPASWYAGDNSFEVTSPFGRDLAPVNGKKDGEGKNAGDKLTDAGDWLTKALDLQGYRLDYVKGVDADFLKRYLNAGAMHGKFAVGEYYDGDLNKLKGWVAATGYRASAFDFSTRYALRDMCNGNGSYDMSWLDNVGLQGALPYNAVTFVENHDTDGSDPVVRNKVLAYAFILTSEGYPCVFLKDYLSASEGGYGLREPINRLVWLHEKVAYGGTDVRWKDPNLFAFERWGGGSHPPLLVALNDSGTPRTVVLRTRYTPNTVLRDYSGHAPNATTFMGGDTNTYVEVTVPGCVNGDGGGYVCFAVDGLTGGFDPPQLATTQEFAGAVDLDIRPADNPAVSGHPLNTPARITAQAGRNIGVELYWLASEMPAGREMTLSLKDPAGAVVAESVLTSSSVPGKVFDYVPVVTGAFAFTIRSNIETAMTGPRFWLKVTYTAPRTSLFGPRDALRAAAGLRATAPGEAVAAGGTVDIVEALRQQRSLSGM